MQILLFCICAILPSLLSSQVSPPVYSPKNTQERKQHSGNPAQRDPSQSRELENCFSSSVCSNGLQRNWAQEIMGLDLVAEDLKESDAKVKVAIIDDGFDFEGSRQHLYDTSPAISHGYQYEGPYVSGGNFGRAIGPIKQMQFDRSNAGGHGTAVTGLIAGAHGLSAGKNVEVKVFQVFDRYRRSTVGLRTRATIQRACDEGYKVINASFGNIGDESGILEMEEENKKLLDYLASKGCIVVASAGNSSFRTKRDHLNRDDAYIRVEASDLGHGLSSFTSNGELLAPGADVFTLKSEGSFVSKYSQVQVACEDFPHGNFVNGTSFSAPLVSGVVALIRGELENKGFVERLRSQESSLEVAHAKEIALVNRILQASQINGEVHAFKAWTLTKQLAEHRDQNRPENGVEELNFEKIDEQFITDLAGEYRDPICEERERCFHQKNCQEFKSCFNRLRRASILCPPQKIDGRDRLEDMIDLSLKHDHIELALQYLDLAKTRLAGFNPEVFIQRMYRKLKDRWRMEKFDAFSSNLVKFHVLVKLLPYFEGEKLEELLNVLLSSTDLEERIRKRIDFGSEQDLAVLAASFNQLRLRIGDESFVELFNRLSSRSTSTLAIARLFNEFFSRESFQSVSEELKKTEEDFYRRVLRNPQLADAYFKSHTWFREGLLRNKNQLQEVFQEISRDSTVEFNIMAIPLAMELSFAHANDMAHKAVELREFTQLRSRQSVGQLDSEQSLRLHELEKWLSGVNTSQTMEATNRYRNFVKKVLFQLAHNDHWPSYHRKQLGRVVRQQLAEQIRELPPDEARRVEDLLYSSIGTANNVDFVSGFFPEIESRDLVDMSAEEFQEKTGMNLGRLVEIAARRVRSYRQGLFLTKDPKRKQELLNLFANVLPYFSLWRLENEERSKYLIAGVVDEFLSQGLEIYSDFHLNKEHQIEHVFTLSLIMQIKNSAGIEAMLGERIEILKQEKPPQRLRLFEKIESVLQRANENPDVFNPASLNNLERWRDQLLDPEN